MKVMTKQQLDALSCSGCEAANGGHKPHGPMYLHGRCHIRAKMTVYYQDGVVHVDCGDCGAPVAMIAVADPTVVRDLAMEDQARRIVSELCEHGAHEVCDGHRFPPSYGSGLRCECRCHAKRPS